MAFAQPIKQPNQQANKQNKIVSQSIPAEYYIAKIKPPRPPQIHALVPNEKLVDDLDKYEIELPPSLPKNNGINIDKFGAWSMKDDLHPLAMSSANHIKVLNNNQLNNNMNNNNFNDIDQSVQKMQISGSFTCMQLMGGNYNYSKMNKKNKEDDQSSTPSTFNQPSQDQQNDEDMMDVDVDENDNDNIINNNMKNNNEELNEDMEEDLHFGAMED